MATNEKTQKDTAKAKSRTFGRSKQTQKDTAKAESRTFGSSKRAKEEEEEELLVQEEILRNNPMMQPTDLIGQRGQQETGMDTNPLLMGGLGLGGGLVASQTGGAPVTSQVLSPFAQKVAAQDASRMAGQNLPKLIGGPQSYQGVPTGPNTPPQFTGNAPARPIPGTQLAPPNQPPAVSSAGGAPANTARPMKAAQRVGPPATIGAGAAATGLLARLNPYVGAATGGYLGGKAIDAFGGDALRAVGLTEREGNISDILGSSVGEAIYGDGNLPALSNEELASIRGIDPNAPQMSRLGDEPLVFNAPTGPSSTVPQAAQLAATLPDDAGLMGAPGVQGTGIPTTTIDVDGGSATVPQALADQTFRGVGSAPMGVEETRARLGGRTLNEYLNAPDGTPGVYGLRTDPQGRMIPAGAPGTSQTRADAYGQYEDEVSQAYQRQSEQMQQRADQRDGTAGPRTYGGYTTSQIRGMVGGGDNLRAAQMRAEAGLNPVTGNREKTEAERSQSEQQGQLQNELLQARLDSFKQTEPDKLSNAESYADRLKLQGDARTAFIFALMGTAMDDVFGLEGTGAGGGGGSFTEAQQSSISKVMAANPGSSREQVIAEMKKQGKL